MCAWYSRSVNTRWLGVACLWIHLPLVLCCSEAPLAFDASTAGSGAPALPDDVIAICDGADDGTPCDADDPRMHCVLNVCSENVCGDNVVAGDEQCDDGNDVVGDGCSKRCRIETGAVLCGNGRIDEGEECDDHNRIDDDTCSNRCLQNACRNGRIDPGEECDDGDRTNDNACANTCTENRCGNLRTDPGEECDDGNTIDDDACANACTENRCGNLRVDPGELCDGDVVDGQSCNSTCDARGNDTCMTCMAERCASTYSYDVYTSCHVMVLPEQVGNPVTGFVDRCTTLDQCVRRNECYDASLGIVPCYCGEGVDPALCQAGTLVSGPCIEEARDATLCPPNDPACVLGLLTDLTLPSGFATYLAECRAIECATECAQ